MVEDRAFIGCPQYDMGTVGTGDREHVATAPYEKGSTDMTTTLARGKYVLVRADLGGQSRLLTDGAVVYRDGTILEVGPYEELRRRHEPDESVGNGRQFLIPGLINAHHHDYGMTYLQLGIPNMPLELRGLWGAGGRSLDPYTMTLYTAMGHIRSGTTTVMLKDNARPPVQQTRHNMDEKLRGYKDAEMRLAYSLNFANRGALVMGDDEGFVASLPSELAPKARELIRNRFLTFDEYEDIYKDLARRYPATPDSLVRMLVSPQEYRWVDEPAMVRLKELAKTLSMGIHVNNVESMYQRMYAERTHGQTPTRRLYELGFLGPEVAMAHCVWLTKNDIEMMAETGAGAINNVSSNLRLRSGVSPVLEMLRQGVTVAIATDSDSFNDDDDMITDMRLAMRMHRPPGLDVEPLSSHQVMHMATLGGAKLTTFGEENIGSLEPGRRADMVLLDWDAITHPFIDDDVDPLDAILYRAKGSDVQTTIVDGKVVYSDGNFHTIDVEALTKEVRQQLQGPLPEAKQKARRLAEEVAPYVKQFYRDWTLDTEPYYPYHSSR